MINTELGKEMAKHNNFDAWVCKNYPMLNKLWQESRFDEYNVLLALSDIDYEQFMYDTMINHLTNVQPMTNPTGQIFNIQVKDS